MCLLTQQEETLKLTELVVLTFWSLAADSESQIIVTIEFRMKERNVFLCRETRWQLRLLQGETEKPKCSSWRSLLLSTFNW